MLPPVLLPFNGSTQVLRFPAGVSPPPQGGPAALVIGVEGQDLEQILLGSDAAFWKMIQERRLKAATLTSDDIRRSFGIQTAADAQGSPGAKPKRRVARPTRG